MEKLDNGINLNNIAPGIYCYKYNNDDYPKTINLEVLLKTTNMYKLVKEAMDNNGIVACDDPIRWRKVYPNCTFVEFKDTIHHVFNRPVYIYGLDEYVNSICKDIVGYTLTED